jgi:predicted component of type VI protein secretion system
MEIKHKLELYEPRISEIVVAVETREDDNAYIVNIEFSISLIAERQKTQVKLNKVR